MRSGKSPRFASHTRASRGLRLFVMARYLRAACGGLTVVSLTIAGAWLWPKLPLATRRRGGRARLFGHAQEPGMMKMSELCVG